MIEIYTNLSLLDDEYISMFREFNIHIATSFYSINEDIHDSITMVKGSQHKTIEALDKLKANKIPFRIGIVIMNENVNDCNVLRDWLNERYNLFDQKKFDIIRPIGRGKNFEHVPKSLFNERYIDNAKKISNNNFENYFYKKYFNSCWGNKVCLKSDGHIFPCVMSKVCLGNFKNIIKILDRKDSYRFLTKDKIKVCKRCEFRYLCNECRAMYSNKKRDLKNKPFTCSYDPSKNCFKGEEKYEN